MRIRILLLASIGVIGPLYTQGLRAQDSKITTNAGMGLTVPLSSTGRLVGSSLNAVVGVGYNVNQYHSLVGQFMWAGLPVDKQSFRPVQLIPNTNDVKGSSNLYSLTANYRFSLQGDVFGVYGIGGGGGRIGLREAESDNTEGDR